MFEGQGQGTKVKVTRDRKRHFSALSAACVRLMFGKISLASSFYLCMKYLENGGTDLRQFHREEVFGPSLGSLNIKVKGQRPRSPGTKTRCPLPSPTATTEWNALAANDVTQRQTAPFRRCRG